MLPRQQTISIISPKTSSQTHIVPSFRFLPSRWECRAGSGGERSERDRGAASIKWGNPAKAGKNRKSGFAFAGITPISGSAPNLGVENLSDPDRKRKVPPFTAISALKNETSSRTLKQVSFSRKKTKDDAYDHRSEFRAAGLRACFGSRAGRDPRDPLSLDLQLHR